MSRSQRGDTLVEVMIAIAILSMAIVGGLTIMNYGYSVANNAVERTQVQATMEGQLALVSYARDAFIRSDGQVTDPGSQMWQAIQSRIVTGSGSNNAHCNNSTPAPGSNSFYINENLAALGTASIANFTGTRASTLATPGQGMWIEARRAGGSIPYVDFYVKACWDAIGTSPNQEARTVVRLYVPS